MFRKYWLIICFVLIFSAGCGNISKKPLPEESRAQLTKEVKATLDSFFTFINSEANLETLNKLISNEILLLEIKKGLENNPDRLANEEIALLSLTVNIVKIENNLLTAKVSGKLSNEMSFANHEFVFKKEANQWKIDYF